jgi:hypothetical protein
MPNCCEVRGIVTRRALLGQFACFTGWAQSAAGLPQAADEDPLRLLRPEHPRLILPDSDLDRIRQLVRENPLARRVYGDLEKECDRLLSVPPIEYKFNGTRLQAQTRRAIDRITTLALMYRLAKRDPWLRRAIMEMNAAANFRDWNPTRFVETAEMTYAFAIGYDWLFNALSVEERTWVREAIVTKGLDQALPIYQKQAWWTRERFNWNVVCNSAMTMGALAVADAGVDNSAHEKAVETFRAALDSIPHGLSSWGTDGGWPEGPFFGEFAARYASLFFASLETALGNDFGLGSYRSIDRAGRYRIYTTGPTNRVFNFGDVPADDPGPAPEMFWMARRFNNPVYAWNEQKQLEHTVHPDALDMAWFDRDSKPPQTPAWPLDAVFHAVAVATFRSAWEDPNAIYLAVKGGDNKAGHAHLDLGAFVLDAGGVRWAADPGADDFTTSGPQRNSFYRVRTESHNTLLIDGDNQDIRAEARITRQEMTPDFSWVQIDLSKASPKVKQWIRRIGMAQRQAVVIQDALHCDMPVEVIWGMMTDSDVTVNGPTATLRRNGWNLTAEIRSPRHAVFDIAPVRLVSSPSQNPKYQKLIVRLLEKVTDLDLNIVLTPWRDGQTKPKITAQFPSV